MRWVFLVLFVGAIAWVVLNREPESRPAPPPSAPPPATQVQPPAPPPALDPGRVTRLQAAARQTGVELRAVQPREGGAELAVAWAGDVATRGADFLEQCVREGLIRDFDLNINPGGTVENGRRVFLARYQVRF